MHRFVCLDAQVCLFCRLPPFFHRSTTPTVRSSVFSSQLESFPFILIFSMTIPAKDNFSRFSHFWRFSFFLALPPPLLPLRSITGMIQISAPRVMLMMTVANANAVDVTSTFVIKVRQINKICQVYSVQYTYFGRLTTCDNWKTLYRPSREVKRHTSLQSITSSNSYLSK